MCSRSRIGLPLAKDANHGLGTQSIRHVVEKLHGNCQFAVKDYLFVLRVVL
ncbi:MAG TPA: GHKL domain-containing protein [Clostridia bacterium]|nr:ATP-binding protein [Clostridiaceae bacterium]HPZ52595.1 GHKL domain-containing protein [Clostridia bacterium]